MTTIERAIYQIQQSACRSAAAGPILPDVRIQLIVVIAFIVTTLSIPVDDPASLLWLFCYPIICSEATGLRYASILARSLWLLPLIALIGIFNPIIDTAPVWHIGRMTVTHGWLTFASLLLRGLLTLQGLLILIGCYGFYDLCRALQSLRCPKALVTQLMMLYRYIGVLLREALSMQRARQARGYGHRHLSLKMWGVLAGQLLLRSVGRARRVHRAMVARGFCGTYIFKPYPSKPGAKDYIYLIVWIAIFAAIRFIDLTTLFFQVTSNK